MAWRNINNIFKIHIILGWSNKHEFFINWIKLNEVKTWKKLWFFLKTLNNSERWERKNKEYFILQRNGKYRNKSSIIRLGEVDIKEIDAFLNQTHDENTI